MAFASMPTFIDHLKLTFVAAKLPSLFAEIDIAARPEVFFHHVQGGRLIAWNGHSSRCEKRKTL